MKVYIAAPFFNPAQTAFVALMEHLFKGFGIDHFSPRSQDANRKTSLTDEDAAEIYHRNIAEMDKCDTIIAVLDWLMPVGREVRIVGTEQPRFEIKPGAAIVPREEFRELCSPPLNIPDSGTVFEIGFIAGLNHAQFGRNNQPIYGITTRPEGEKVNIMITQALDGVFYGLDHLREFLEQKREPSKGKWRHR